MIGLSYFWKMLGKSKKTNDIDSTNRLDFFDKISSFKTTASIKAMLLDKKNMSLNTDKEVVFRGVTFGATIREATQRLGKPLMHVENSQDVDGHDILIYKTMVGSVKVTQCLHFMHDCFILGQCIVKQSRSGYYRTFIETVLKKYDLLPAGDQSTTDVMSMFPICDKKGNRIEIQQDLYLTLSCISGDAKAVQLVDNSFTQTRTKQSYIENTFKDQVLNLI